MTNTMSYREVAPGVIAVAHQPVPLVDEEWEAFLDLLRSSIEAGRVSRVLVRAEGQGGPDVNQRSTLAETCSAGDVMMAVLTNSVTVRGIVTAVSWLGSVRVRAFTPGNERAAAAYLELDDAVADATIKALGHLGQ